MRDLSLHVLDIVENATAAGATIVDITVAHDTARDTLTITIADNGSGMAPDVLARVTDPFYTSRMTRKVGLGIPLFRMAAELTGGSLHITSQQGAGTTVTAAFARSHIDRPPLGDMGQTMKALVMMHPAIDFSYTYRVDDRDFTLSTIDMKDALDVPVLTGPALTFISDMIDENTQELDNAIPNNGGITI